MADTFKKQAFKYVVLAPPSELLNSSIFVIDFTTRKFVHVRFNSQNNFNIGIHIISSSRFISINAQFFKWIYTLLGNFLSFILDPQQKYRESIFLYDGVFTLSKSIYQGRINRILNSWVQERCRVMLNITDLFALKIWRWLFLTMS
jgi:hypothetical protein